MRAITITIGTFPNCSTAGFPSGRYPSDICGDVSKTDAVPGLSRETFRRRRFLLLTFDDRRGRKGAAEVTKDPLARRRVRSVRRCVPRSNTEKVGRWKCDRTRLVSSICVSARTYMYVYARREKNQRILFTDIISNDKRCVRWNCEYLEWSKKSFDE